MKHANIWRTLILASIIALLAATVPARPALAQTIDSISPSTGKPGSRVTIVGYGFTGATVGIYFARGLAGVGTIIKNQVNAYELLTDTIPSDEGETTGVIDVSFTIPAELSLGDAPERVKNGRYYIYVTSAIGTVKARQEFTVAGVSDIAITPTEGTVGTGIKVSGSGFVSNGSVTIKFAGTQVGTASTNSAGSFSEAAVTVPGSYRGSHTVEVTDASNNAATASFTTKQSATISPASGKANTTITISGTGFQANKTMLVTFGAEEMTTNPVSVASDSKGSFSATFNAPVNPAGGYTVTVSDGTNTSSHVFTLPFEASISPTTGYVGTEVTVSGQGFQGSKAIPIIMGNELVATANTDARGTLSASFAVPPLGAGSYKVKISDGSNTFEADFSISTSASITPQTSAASPGYIGSELTVSGLGFIPGRTVIVSYDGVQATTAAVSTQGSFTATFKAPASKSGAHIITATDLVNTSQFTFVMESDAPPTPPPLKPEMGIKAEARTFFDWQDVTDPSGVTYILQIASEANFSPGAIILEKSGLTQSEYTLTEGEELKSVSKDSPYYWRLKAVDGAGNESDWTGTGSFRVGFTFGMPPWVVYTLLGIGALLLCIFSFWLGRKTAYY